MALVATAVAVVVTVVAANAIATATANKPRSVSFASELWWPAADRRRPAHRW